VGSPDLGLVALAPPPMTSSSPVHAASIPGRGPRGGAGSDRQVDVAGSNAIATMWSVAHALPTPTTTTSRPVQKASPDRGSSPIGCHPGENR
jgi:hypothetical protein